MNKDEWITLITALVSKAGAAAFGAGVMTSSDATMIAGGVFALGSLTFSMWNTWNMRKVKETSVVTGTAPTVAMAKAASIEAGK